MPAHPMHDSGYHPFMGTSIIIYHLPSLTKNSWADVQLGFGQNPGGEVTMVNVISYQIGVSKYSDHSPAGSIIAYH